MTSSKRAGYQMKRQVARKVHSSCVGSLICSANSLLISSPYIMHIHSLHVLIGIKKQSMKKQSVFYPMYVKIKDSGLDKVQCAKQIVFRFDR